VSQQKKKEIKDL